MGLKGKVALAGLILACVAAAPAGELSWAGTPGSAGDTTADRVIGQVDFTKIKLEMVDPIGLEAPFGIAWDASSSPHHLYVADGNARVLGWRDASSFANGAPADLVIGQPDFYSSDCNDGTAPDDVLGVGPDSLCSPTGLAVDPSGNLFVADSFNNRVLEYPAPFAACTSFPCVGPQASVVFGQLDFVSRVTRVVIGPGTPDPTTLLEPIGVAVDRAGNLYVADTDSNRVLEYSPPFTNGQAANLVFGQPDFSSNGIDSRVPKDADGPGPDSLAEPIGVAVDSAGNVWIADHDDNRVLEYDDPLATGVKCTPHSDGSGCPGDTIADRVYGQRDFVSGSAFSPPGAYCGPQSPPPPPSVPPVSPSSLCGPFAVAIDPTDHLYVADSYDNRVLEYDRPLAQFTTAASRVFGQHGNFGSFACGSDFDDTTSADSLCEPTGLALDSRGDLFVSDPFRVLEYFDPVASRGGRPGTPGYAGDTTADRVLGQISFTKGLANFVDGRAIGFTTPEFLVANFFGVAGTTFGAAVAIDTSSAPNHLYVADAVNNRVLGWADATGFANGAAADIVVGQPDVYSPDCNGGGKPSKPNAPTAASLCTPTGLTVDAKGNLWVADTANNRVLKFAAPFKSGKKAGMSASLVIGTCGGGFGPSQCHSTRKDSLSVPAGVAVDADGHVYVADSGNNRVLEYDNPGAGGIDLAATRVFGQNGSFTANACAFFSAPSLFTGADLCGPRAVAVDQAGNLYVSDIPNADAYGRVLEYDNPTATTAPHPAAPGFAGDTIPDRVFGQPDLNTIESFPPGPDTLQGAAGVTVDSNGNVYIADLGNNRVLEYDDPLAPGGGTPGVPGSAGDTTADRVFGQNGDFTTKVCANLNFNFSPPMGTPPSADTLCTPSAVAVDAAGDLFIVDFGDSRVLEYDQPLPGTQ